MKTKLERLRLLALRNAAAVGALGLTGSAFAAVDVDAVVTEINGASTPIAAIGAAVLLVMVGIKVFKWVRRAM